MTRGEYLNACLEMGMSRKEAMLTTIAEVNGIAAARRRAYDDAREKARKRK